MYRIRKKFKFEAAHRLSSGYSAECVDYIHGHSYIVELFIEAKELNADGMVVDFGYVKTVVKPLIDEWDHKLILESGYLAGTDDCLQVNFNPTAENMAEYLYDKCHQYGITVSKIRVHETDSGYAEFFKE